MNKPEKPIHFKILEYARKENGPFNLADMINNLNLDAPTKKMVIDQVRDGQILFHSYHANAFSYSDLGNLENSSIRVSMSALDAFRLNEYEELEFAKKSASSAKKTAIVAILISILTAISSIGFSYYQVSTESKLPNKLFETMDRQLKLSEETNNLLRGEK